ncbi:MAG: hypothetical protein AAGJ84_13635 [Pseudomonadota bacterium]
MSELLTRCESSALSWYSLFLVAALCGASFVIAFLVASWRHRIKRNRITGEGSPTPLNENSSAIRDLTLVSLVAGIVLATLGYQQSSAQTLTNRTLNLLAMISESEIISESDYQMARWIAAGERFDGDVDRDTDRHIINLLDYYEFLGVAWERGAVQRDTLLMVRCGPMVRAFEVNQQYIRDRRMSLNAPNLYARYEHLVRECNRRGYGT